MVVLLVLLFNLLLVSPDLMPDFSDINPYDEAKYIESGSLLWKFEFRELAWGPLVAFVYAPFHLVLGGMPDWFLAEAWAGRILLFILLWLSTLYLTSKLGNDTQPYVAMGILFVNLSFFLVIENPSDALFVTFSVLALAKLISFERTHLIQDVWLGSAFVGLCVLARVEAIFLIPLFLILTLVLGRLRHDFWRLVLATLLPGLTILAVYILISFISSGSLDLGVGSKSYDSFEVNQPVMQGGDLGHREEAERLFGTAEENQGSVLRAILRNPIAFAERILVNAMKIPEIYLSFFGKRLGPVLLLFAIWGAYVLVRKRGTLVLGIIFLWSLQPLISLGFLPLHLVPQIGYLPLVLGAIGISHALGPEVSDTQRLTHLLVAILLVVYGWLDAKLALLMGGLIMAFVLGLAWRIQLRTNTPRTGEVFSLMLLLAGALVLRGSYHFPDFPELGSSPEENAIHVMQSKLPPGSKVLISVPGPALAAGMKPVKFSEPGEEATTEDKLQTLLRDEDIRAIYIDRRYRMERPLSELLDSIWSNCLERGHAAGDGPIRLFLAGDFQGGVGVAPLDRCLSS